VDCFNNKLVLCVVPQARGKMPSGIISRRKVRAGLSIKLVTPISNSRVDGAVVRRGLSFPGLKPRVRVPLWGTICKILIPPTPAG
jgi:hypothetical protein